MYILVVPHKVVAEVSKIGNLLYRRGWLLAVNHRWQSKPTDGPKCGLSCAFWSGCSGHLTHNCWI